MQLWYPNATRDPQEDGGSMTAGPARGILHTTESSGYPSYRPGTHPHFTVWVDAAGVPRIRQHVPLNRAARALMHPAGTIDTNRHGAIQIEIATFAAKVTAAPRSLLVATRTLMRWIEQQAGVHRHAPRFKAYPSSYGTNNGVRFTDQQWADFNGWCGHQHVPENDHGDPGLIDITYLLGASPAAPEDDLTPDQAKTLDLIATRELGLIAMVRTVSNQMSAISLQVGAVSRQVSRAAGADAAATTQLEDAVKALDAANVNAQSVVDEIAKRLETNK